MNKWKKRYKKLRKSYNELFDSYVKLRDKYCYEVGKATERINTLISHNQK